MKKTIQQIKWRLRRLYFIYFHRDYVLNQINIKRIGKCEKHNHSCCDKTWLDRLINVHLKKCFDSKTNLCKDWENRPFGCHSYPFDEKDFHPLINYCNFKFEE